jgi:nitrogen fixation protein FixH
MIFRLIFTKIFAAVLILFAFQQVGSANEKDSVVQQIFTFIYNQQFNAAEKTLHLQSGQMEPFWVNVLTLDLFWWKYSLSRSNEDARQLKKVLAGFHKPDDKLPEEQTNELIRLSYEMRYEVKRYNLIGAFLLRSDVRDKIETLKMQDLSFLGNRRQLFDIYLALIDSFDSMVNPFSSGSKSEKYSKSIEALEKYSLSGDLIISTMAHYFLGRIYMKVEKKPQNGQEHFKILAQRFPENPLFYELANGINPKF